MANEEQKSEPVSESKEIIVEKITETPRGVIESQNEIVEKQTKELDSIIGDEGNEINIEGSKQDVQEFKEETKEIKTEADETKEEYYEELKSNIPNLDDQVEYQKKKMEKQGMSAAESKEVSIETGADIAKEEITSATEGKKEEVKIISREEIEKKLEEIKAKAEFIRLSNETFSNKKEALNNLFEGDSIKLANCRVADSDKSYRDEKLKEVLKFFDVIRREVESGEAKEEFKKKFEILQFLGSSKRSVLDIESSNKNTAEKIEDIKTFINLLYMERTKKENIDFFSRNNSVLSDLKDTISFLEGIKAELEKKETQS